MMSLRPWLLCVCLVPLAAAAQLQWNGNPVGPGYYFCKNYKLSLSSTAPQFEPAMCADNHGGVFVFWKDGNSGVSVNRYTASPDWGLTWRIPKKVNDTRTYETDPVVFPSADGGAVHFIWHAFNSGAVNNIARHQVTTDRGKTLVDLPNSQMPNDQPDRCWGLVSRDGITYTSYLYSTNGSHFGWSTDGGSHWTWSSDALRGISAHIACGLTPGEVYCCPADNAFGYTPSLRFYRSTNYGATFGSPTLTFTYAGVSFDNRWNYFPCIFTNPVNGHVYMVYADAIPESGGARFGIIRFRRSKDGGVTWEAPVALNTDSYSPSLPVTDIVNRTRPYPTLSPKYHPWMAVDSRGFIHVAWQDARYGQFVIFYVCSRDDGDHFTPETLVTDRPFTLSQTYYGEFIALAADDRNVYVAWPDGREGNTEIYFSKAPIWSIVP